jgi:multidrug efflux system outer membrane protein
LWGVQKADQLPNATVGLTRSASLTPGGVTASSVPYELNSVTAGLNLLSYEVDVWGRVANLSAAAKASYVATEEDRRTIRMGLISDVANAYLQVQELEERTQLAHDTVEARQKSLALVRSKRDVGAASDLDVLTADGSLSSALADESAIDRQRQQAINGLKLIIGGEWPANLPAKQILSAQSLPPKLLADLPSQVLLRRPDVRAAEQRLMAANANIGAARAAFLPKIQLTGALGSSSTSLSNLFGAGTRSWSFIPSIQQPLFDGGRNSSNLDVAQARKVTAVASYEKTIQTAFREVADLLVAQSTLQDQLNAQNANLKSQNERLRLVQSRYGLGAANQLELLDAQRDSYSAQQNAVQVLRQLFSTTSLLFKALGGDIAN